MSDFREALRRSRGFTLFEMLVSAGLVLLLIVAMTSFMSDAIGIRTRVSEQVGRARAADAAMSAIERALETSLVEDAAMGAGVTGTETSISILRSGLATWRLGTDERTRAMEEIDRVRVEFDSGSGKVLIGRGERPASPIPGELFRVRFRYYDEGVWHTRFDSVKTGHLPAAVEVAIWFAKPRGEAMVAERPEFDAPEPSADETSDIASDGDGDGDKNPPDRLRIVAIPDAAAELAVAP